MKKLYRVERVETKEEYGVRSFLIRFLPIGDDEKYRGGWPVFYETFDEAELPNFPVNSLAEIEINPKK